jgi:hypothetical protein
MFANSLPDAWPLCFVDAFVRLGLGLAGLAADGREISSPRY